MKITHGPFTLEKIEFTIPEVKQQNFPKYYIKQDGNVRFSISNLSSFQEFCRKILEVQDD